MYPFAFALFLGIVVGRLSIWLAGHFVLDVLEALKKPSRRICCYLVAFWACYLLLQQFGFSVRSLCYVLLLLLWLSVSLTDLCSFFIPDSLTLAGCVLFLFTALSESNPIPFLLHGFGYGCVLSGGMLFLSLCFDQIMKTESMGGGDSKLLFMTGLYLSSFWELFFFLPLSSCLGILLAVIRREQRLPFGPAISAAGFLLLLYGEAMTAWYLGFFK